MTAALIAVRDFLLALALAWVGVTLERAQETETVSGAPACTAADKSCAFSRPSFDAFDDCPET